MKEEDESDRIFKEKKRMEAAALAEARAKGMVVSSNNAFDDHKLTIGLS